ncbi:MAG: hypothetical protein SFY68_12240, partial [Candidatus Sumerlaeia bacterium]|nr:hypothetical protein [Candidatus Sumerlaeia bacterium]
ANTQIQWSAAIPNGVKSFELSLNGTPLQTGISPTATRTADLAPRSVPARENTVALNLGSNALRAVVTDWRGNTTEENLTIVRYPQALTPAKRNALILALDPIAQKSAQALQGALADPFVGQFEAAQIRMESNLANADAVRSAVDAFSRTIVAGELAVVHVIGKGNTSTKSLTVGGSEISLADFMKACRESFATDEVIITLDVDWNAESKEKVLDAAGEMPGRWALVASNGTYKPTKKVNGGFAYTESLVASLKKPQTSGRLTLERTFDLVGVDVELRSEGAVKPEVRGRYNPNITMVSYE